MAGVKISNLPALVAAQLADLIADVQPASGGTTYKATLQQLLDLFMPNITLLGAQSQALNMNTHLINNLVDPVSAQDAATKHYVDLVAQGLTIQGACRVATTVALTVTYANGTAGVGATLTNAGAQAAIAIDGVTLALNDRVLVKNQASTFQNGIYVVTVLGDGATNWVLTRATDYDQVAEINPGDLVLINAGTANANSSWVETATVVTMGTSPITFSQFTGQAASKSVSDNTKPSVASVAAATTSGNLASFADITGTVQNAVLNSAQFYVGSAGNQPVGVAMSGDVGLSNTGLTTIQAGAITPTKIAANSGVGIPVQVVFASLTTTTSIASATPVSTGVTASITPSATTSKIHILVTLNFSVPGSDNGFVRLVNGSTAIGVGAAAGTRTVCASQINTASATLMSQVTMQWVDSPASVSAQTYTAQAWTNAGNQAYINRTITDTDTAVLGRGVSTITLTEIK